MILPFHTEHALLQRRERHSLRSLENDNSGGETLTM